MSDSERRNTDRYWKREETALGRAFNDVMDGARELANRVQYVLPGRTQSEREMFQRAIREDREEKQWTREHYKQTGRMETRDEIAADAHYSAQHRAHAAEQGWKPNEHPEDPHYHERFGNQEPSLSREIVGNRQILPFVDGKDNGTMDRQVKAAKEHVREREQERWTRVEQIGRQAIDSDRVRVTEKPTVTTEADLATKAERQRPQTA